MDYSSLLTVLITLMALVVSTLTSVIFCFQSSGVFLEVKHLGVFCFSFVKLFHISIYFLNSSIIEAIVF